LGNIRKSGRSGDDLAGTSSVKSGQKGPGLQEGECPERG